MSENYNDYGDYSEELVYQSKSKLGKFFSFRTLRTVGKALFFLIVIFVYGILFFRLCTGNPRGRLTKLIWTENTLAAYQAAGERGLTVYAQEPVEHMARDGYFAIYDVRYIAETEEIQLTVRYNNSSTEKLRADLVKEETEKRKKELLEESKLSGTPYSEKELEAALAASLEKNPITVELSKQPFVFLLRDNFGRVYTSYYYISDSKTVYQYQRLSFSGVDLFGKEKTEPKNAYPSPKVEKPADLYKGANAGKNQVITHLYLDMYYEKNVGFEDEAFANPLLVYRNVSELDVYDYRKELSGVVTEGLLYRELSETKP